MLHDHIGHGLAFARIKLEDAQHSRHPASGQAVSEAMQAVDEAIKATRSLTFEISPPILHQIGLAAALEWLAQETQDRYGFECSFDHRGSGEALDESLRILLFQTARELLFNVVKHAKTKNASIVLEQDEARILLTVTDEGVGFDAESLDIRDYAGGFGLFSIQERMRYLGGDMRMQSELGKGTSVSLDVPISELHELDRDKASERSTAKMKLGEPDRIIKVLIADDHQLIRKGIRVLIEEEKQMEVVGEATNGAEAVKLAAELAPDVVVMDIDMPTMDGTEATASIVGINPAIRIVALSMHSEKQIVGEMLKAGARGYLLKDSADRDLVNAIYAVDSDLTFLSESIRDVVVEGLTEQLAPAQSASLSVLSTREQEVLVLLVAGETSKGIAIELGISNKTVDAHRQNIMKKLGVLNLAELVKLALREGLTDSENLSGQAGSR